MKARELLEIYKDSSQPCKPNSRNVRIQARASELVFLIKSMTCRINYRTAKMLTLHWTQIAKSSSINLPFKFKAAKISPINQVTPSKNKY